MADKRITDVDFIDSLKSDESFFVNQNNTIKQINKGKITFDIVNGGTGASDAATALINLGAAEANHTHNIDSLTGFDEYTYDATVTRTANAILAAPNGTDGVASFRSLDNADLPTISIEKGGTGATDGSTAIQNLFASGITVLSSYQYGDTLPEAGTVGRIFLKKVVV